ncbi:MAG: hypothetical protein NC131_11355 [Roseburia sp.]|nr:hypothetical protein [Roseburia sp.]
MMVNLVTEHTNLAMVRDVELDAPSTVSVSAPGSVPGTVSKRAGILVRIPVPITVVGNAVPVAVADVRADVVKIVPMSVPENLVLPVVTEVVRLPVNMVATRIVWELDVGRSAVLKVLVHAKQTAGSIVCPLLVLRCVRMLVSICVLHVLTHVDGNVVHAPTNVPLDVRQSATSTAQLTVPIAAAMIVLTAVQRNAAGVPTCATPVWGCALEPVLSSARLLAPTVPTTVVGGVTPLVIGHASQTVIVCASPHVLALVSRS